jgi:catechol 2,3-dioxygenase-like lactoylglutathione lyase family enzyme
MSDGLSGLHHVACACRDLDATHHFYADVLGLPLVHTENTPYEDGWFRHVFYDLGGGAAIAFFDLHGVGEPDPLRTAISTDLGLPSWVNHVAIRCDEGRRDEVLARLEADGGEEPLTLDHGWCRSTYLLDPNGIVVELCVDTPGLPVEPEEAERLRHVEP